MTILFRLCSFSLALAAFIVLSHSVAQAIPICYVYDGNTILTCDGYKITLDGIHAPELNEPNGPQSRQYLIKEVQNKDVVLHCGGSAQPFQTYNFPAYARMPGTCFARQYLTITDGTNRTNYVNYIDCQQLYSQTQGQSCFVTTGPVDIQRRMVSQGWAYNRSGAKYAGEETLARNLRLGIWH